MMSSSASFFRPTATLLLLILWQALLLQASTATSPLNIPTRLLCDDKDGTCANTNAASDQIPYGATPTATPPADNDLTVDCDDGRYWCLKKPASFWEHCDHIIDFNQVCSDMGANIAVPKPKKSRIKCANLWGEEQCEALAKNGHDCLLNPSFMLDHCAKACRKCLDHDYSATDDNFRKRWTEVSIGVTQFWPESLPEQVKSDWSGPEMQDWLAVVAETAEYMTTKVFARHSPVAILSARASCRNYDRLCAWNVANEPDFCEDLANKKMCGPACHACADLLLSKDEQSTILKCLPEEEKNAFEPFDYEQVEEENDFVTRRKHDQVTDEELAERAEADKSSKTIDAMFRRIVGELPYPSERPLYPSKILSRPALHHGINNSTVPTPIRSLDYHVGGPWIVVLDDFLTDEECDRLIEMGDKIGRTESSIADDDDGDDGDDGDWRTSTTAWCKDDFCKRDPIVENVQRKIGLTTGVVDDSYYEAIQLLKYVPGQFYKEHHDEQGDVHEERFDYGGPRILTFFLYLNDVEGGGETRFSDLYGDGTYAYIDVKPKKGSALLWPSMRNEDLLAYDKRAYHEALPVTKGEKYAANAWLHLRNIQDSECDEEELESILDQKQPPTPPPDEFEFEFGEGEMMMEGGGDYPEDPRGGRN